MHAMSWKHATVFASLAISLGCGLLDTATPAADLSIELDRVFQQAGALQQAGSAGDTFDAAMRLRLEALVREGKTPEQLRLIETRLVQALESTMPLSAKQEVCRVLWQIGSARAAPALKRLLASPETVDIAWPSLRVC